MNHLKQSSIRNSQNKEHFLSSALFIFKTQVLSVDFLKKSISIALIYLLVSSIINEFAIYSNIFSQQFTLLLKLKISGLMFLKTLGMFGSVHTLLLLSIALVVGINIMLVTRKIAYLRLQKTLQWTFGAGVISLASAGCPGCGLSLLSITGLTPAIPGLPFQGILYLTIIFSILIMSSIYNAHMLGKFSCAIPQQK